MDDKSLIKAITHSLIDKELEICTDSFYQLNLIDNQNQPLLDIIQKLILDCDEFYISVAFLKTGGLKGILTQLNKAEERNIPVKAIIGNMNNFSEPKALSELNKFNNVEIKLNMSGKLHTKGYFFRKEKIWTIIIGSSNLTQQALKENLEWNLLINSLDNGKLVEKSLESFNLLWEKSKELESVFNIYNSKFQQEQELRKKLSSYKKSLIVVEEIQPNIMQVNALKKIEESRKKYNKALIISATGTGKTYLSALDVKRVNPKKLLFVVHRENIAKTAMRSFRKIIDKNISIGEFIGNKKSNCDYLFATIQTISKDENLEMFGENEFDYIIVDEAHRLGSNTHQKVFNYFKPKFLLGLTATPERSDGYNIYELFDYNVPYEIRLNEAIESNIIVPFHYFGVSEVYINDQPVDDGTEIDPKERALNIKNKSEFYNYDGDKVHGLIFVDKVKKAKKLSEELNNIGYKTIALTGKDNENKRKEAIELLQEKDVTKPYLDFIISRDIFNEGIDIPCVNQVLLLRPTKSVIVYIQQLGRGLRKANNKEYLIILDFIGNYKNNFLIPVALSGDATFDVDFLKRFVSSGSSFMPGSCTINFEDISRKLILDKIDKKKFNNKNLIKHDYTILKQRLNRIPLLYDFYQHKMISPEFILNYKKTYPEVIKSIDIEYEMNFSTKEMAYLKYLYQEFNMAKRVHEIIIIKELLKNNKTLEELNNIIEDYLGINNQIENTTNAMAHLKKEIFIKDNTRSKYNPILINNDLTIDFKETYLANPHFKELIDDFINFNLEYNFYHYKQKTENALIIGKNYSRKECFHLMNMDYNYGYQESGYQVNKNLNKVLIFMKADKSSYSNELINHREIIWYSQLDKTLKKNTREAQIAENILGLEIFVKKEDGEKLYYLGKAKVISFEQTTKDNKPIIRYTLRLDTPIEDSLFNYFNY